MTLFSCWATYIQIFLGIIHNIVTTTVTNSTGVEPVSHIYIIKPTCCQNNPAESFLLMHLLVLSYPELMSLWKNEWVDEWMGMKEMEKWMNGGTNEWTSSEQKIYILWVNIEWMSWWMSQNSRWCEWTSKYNAVHSSYDAHDNPVLVHVYLCLFTSDWLHGIHNANNPSGLCQDCILGTFSTLKAGMSPIILAAGAHVPTNLRFMNGNIT